MGSGFIAVSETPASARVQAADVDSGGINWGQRLPPDAQCSQGLNLLAASAYDHALQIPFHSFVDGVLRHACAALLLGRAAFSKGGHGGTKHVVRPFRFYGSGMAGNCCCAPSCDLLGGHAHRCLGVCIHSNLGQAKALLPH